MHVIKWLADIRVGAQCTLPCGVVQGPSTELSRNRKGMSEILAGSLPDCGPSHLIDTMPAYPNSEACSGQRVCHVVVCRCGVRR